MGAIAPNTQNDRIPGGDDTSQAKQNYTAAGLGNDKGSLRFGHIHKQGDVTAGCILQTPDGEHQFSLDVDGPRKGWTCATGPGNFQVECGSANEEDKDSLILNAKNGNICITATNGKIRLQGTDIELVAIGEGQTKGNIRFKATESIEAKCKKYLVSADSMYRMSTTGIGQIVSNSVLECYGSIFRGVTDGAAVKESKVGGKKFNSDNNKT